jgi:hypothetical protein
MKKTSKESYGSADHSTFHHAMTENKEKVDFTATWHASWANKALIIGVPPYLTSSTQYKEVIGGFLCN